MPLQRLVLFFLLGCLLSSSSFGQVESKNLRLVSQRDYTTKLTDIWGYVDENGVEYALVALRNGVSIVNLSDPANPQESDFVPGIFSSWRDVKTHDTYAYVSNESGNGITIIDLSNLPGQVTFKDTIIAGITQAHNLYIDKGVLYVVGPEEPAVLNGGMAMFDIATDPEKPVFLGAYTLRYVHDVYVRDDIAYTAEISDRRLGIVDVSDKLRPELIGQQPYQGAFTHNTWLNESGDVCFTTDEYGGAFLRSWDVSNPAKIKPLDKIRSSLSNGAAIPHNAHALNDFLITSYYRDGVHLTDISRPHNMIEVGYYDTADSLSGNGFNGNWGAYPYLPSGLILASDIEKGLFVLAPTYQKGCYLEGIVTDQVSGALLEDTQVDIIEEDITDFSITDGSYATGIGESGSYRVAFSKFGYEPDTFTVNLSNGVLSSLDVGLVSLSRISLNIEVREQATGNIIPDATILAKASESNFQIEYKTDMNGNFQEPKLVIHPYQLIVGKWGYVTQEAFIAPSENDTSITFLLEKGFYDDFSLDFGWEVTENASKGTWEIAEPDGTYREGNIYAPEFDIEGDIGNTAFVTDNQDDGAFGYDVDRGFTLLSSPWMDLSEYTEPVINYHYWFVNWSLRNGSQNQGPGNDFLSASVTDGTDTIEIKRYEGPFDTTWTQESRFFFQKYFDISTTPLKILFYTQDLEEDNQDAVEAGIDGFRVIETSETPLSPLDDEFLTFKAFPIPVQNLLNLQIIYPPNPSSKAYVFELWDIQGRKILSQAISPQIQNYSLTFPYPSGLYLAQILENGRVVSSKKIIK